MDVIDPTTNNGVTITEVIVDTDTRARGYIVSELDSYEFLYFADVNRATNVLTTYEVISDTTEVFHNLMTSEDYLNTDKFDFIKFSNEYTTLGKGRWRFFGWNDWKDTGPCSSGWKTVHRERYFLGFKVKDDYNLVHC